jgi:hypothetical protein
MNQADDGEWKGEVHLQTTLHISSFGEDADGNLYAADFTAGGIYRVVARTQTPKPVAQRVEPDVYIAGGVPCTMHVRGWNFQPGASMLANGREVPTDYVDGTWLSFSSGDLPASDGTLQITVVNHGDREVESQPLALTVVAGLVGGDAIYQNWARTDLPVQSGEATRTWMWGLPMGSACVELEAYEDSPGGMRAVQYFDKSRMEVTDPAGDPTSEWYVTNGLLVTEMVSGRVQLGDDTWDEREPASINIAGDRQDPDGPTYETIGALLDAPALDDDATVIQRVDRSGTVTEDPAFAGYGVTAAHRVDVAGTDRQIASPFWEFMNASGTVFDGDSFSENTLFRNPFFATGLPIIDPYWARVRVAGEEKDVLIQCFERRCLTYTPSNDPEWQVEAGNVGHHYYLWRYERWR